jgi:integrase
MVTKYIQEWKEEFPRPKLFENRPMHQRKKREVSAGTVARYNHHIKSYLDYLKDNSLQNTMVSVIEFFNSLKAQDAKANTLKLCKAGLKAGFLNIPRYKNDLHFKMIIDSAFKYLETDQPNLRINKNNVLNETELKILFDNTPDRLSCLIQFCYFSGCRISEALNAKLKNVSSNGFVWIAINNTKTKKERTLEVDHWVWKRIQEFYPKTKKYIFETKTGKQLFQQNIYNQLNSRTKKEKASGKLGKFQRIVNGKPLSPHAFRHARATHMLNDGWDVVAVADFLGNTPEMVMKVYGHSQVDVKKLAERDKARFYKEKETPAITPEPAAETLEDFEKQMKAAREKGMKSFRKQRKLK